MYESVPAEPEWETGYTLDYVCTINRMSITIVILATHKTNEQLLKLQLDDVPACASRSGFPCIMQREVSWM